MTTLYRACDGFTGAWSCWTADKSVAQLYRDNPGYGGSEVVETEATGEILDVSDWNDLADAICDVLDASASDLVELWTGAGYGWVYEAWENRRDVREALVESGFSWIRHNQETYPDGATTWVRVQ